MNTQIISQLYPVFLPRDPILKLRDLTNKLALGTFCDQFQSLFFFKRHFNFHLDFLSLCAYSSYFDYAIWAMNYYWSFFCPYLFIFMTTLHLSTQSLVLVYLQRNCAYFVFPLFHSIWSIATFIYTSVVCLCNCLMVVLIQLRIMCCHLIDLGTCLKYWVRNVISYIKKVTNPRHSYGN